MQFSCGGCLFHLAWLISIILREMGEIAASESRSHHLDPAIPVLNAELSQSYKS